MPKPKDKRRRTREQQAIINQKRGQISPEAARKILGKDFEYFMKLKAANKHTRDRALLKLMLRHQGLIRQLVYRMIARQAFQQRRAAGAVLQFNAVLDFNDMVHEGQFGLMRALELFDPLSGIQFSSYARWWIRQSIQRGIAASCGIPDSQYRSYQQIGQTIAQLARERGRSPTTEELCARVGIKPATLATLRSANQLASNWQSLDSCRESDSEKPYTLGSILPDHRSGNQLNLRQLSETLEKMFGEAGLDESERRILELSFGLKDGQPLPLRRIGEFLEISPETARLRQKRALAKLKKKEILAALAPFLPH